MNNFDSYRKNIIGIDQTFLSPYGEKKIVYADWTASGRLYRNIEEFISNHLGPFVANTHTETNVTGTMMTTLYHQAQKIIKAHVNAGKEDVLLLAGFGMTEVINKLQRIIKLRIPEDCTDCPDRKEEDKPLVIITHMEHHSNQITWNESDCLVKIINRGENGMPDLSHLEQILAEHKDRKVKIGSFTACSNVTGILTPYQKMAEIIHSHGGLCFVDFAASAPYVKIDMHPKDPFQKLDAIFFSPHKFLGGPGSSGVVVFDKNLYKLEVPDRPGGGTVLWTNPWGEQRYFDDIEVREDGGTPGFLQAIKVALAIKLKEEMGVGFILAQEARLKNRLMEKLQQHPEIVILEAHQKNRLGMISFYSLHRHHNLIVKLLSDRFGIQTRGGCSCAGTYGHILLNVDKEKSKHITDLIDMGDLSEKPGWVRISIHPTMQEEEIDYIVTSVHQVLANYDEWARDYRFNARTGEYYHITFKEKQITLAEDFRAC